MPRVTQGRSRYSAQRNKVTPPHVSVGDLRVALGLTIDEVIDRMRGTRGGPPVTRGSISAIENGHRGASDDMVRALEAAYGLRAGALSTTYRPRAGRTTERVAS
jgi:transcriptional regulator with XRE-family HTH domain